MSVIREWYSSFCYLNDEVIFVGVMFLVLYFGYSMFVFMRHFNLAEQHVDTDHWAGMPVREFPTNFLHQCLRGNTGLGYTPTGRMIWWDGAKYWFLSWIVFMVLILALVMCEYFGT